MIRDLSLDILEWQNVGFIVEKKGSGVMNDDIYFELFVSENIRDVIMNLRLFKTQLKKYFYDLSSTFDVLLCQIDLLLIGRIGSIWFKAAWN